MKIRKIQSSITNRRSSGGLAAAKARYVKRAISEGRANEVKFANTAKFKTEYNRVVRQNIIRNTKSRIENIVREQNIGSEGKKILRVVLKKQKLGTKAGLNAVKKAAKIIKSKGLKKFVNRKGFVRGIDRETRKGFTELELLKLKDRSEFYFQERNILLDLNKNRDNKRSIKKVKKAYKVFKSEKESEFIEDAFGMK